MNVLWREDTAQFTTIAPAGFRLLGALDRAAMQLGHDLTITSACDGAHSGPDDPHHLGEAFDVRSHDLPDKDAVLRTVLSFLGTPIPVSVGGYVTAYFFGWLEDAGTPNEHFHFQRRKGTMYPPPTPPMGAEESTT